MSSIRRFVLLLVVATFALAPLAQSFAVPASAGCVLEQQAVPGPGCCGDATSGSVCVMGSACMVPVLPGIALENRSVVPVALAAVAMHSQPRAPDTAPPKIVSA